MAPLGRTGTVARSRTVKGASEKDPQNPTEVIVPSKGGKNYGTIEQGIKVLYASDDANVDIVVVPGLGTDPESSFARGKFNWLNHKDGLQLDFPRSRIMLYMSESSWFGGLKVKQSIANLANGLLSGLNTKREGALKTRPIVFIGHSMGGLVIAKAIVIAGSKDEQHKYPLLFESTAAAITFGTPFRGARAADAAFMIAEVGEKFDKAVASSLISLMRPEDESLRELRDDFTKATLKAHPKIELFHFYEEQPTDFAKKAGLPRLFKLWDVIIPKDFADFVPSSSATLDGMDKLGLVCDHQNLVKFDGIKDERYQIVRDPLRRVIGGAQNTTRKRQAATRDINWGERTAVLDALKGTHVEGRRSALLRAVTPNSGDTGNGGLKSWVTKEPEYVNWLAQGQPNKRRDDSLWIRGPEGVGKSGAILACLDEIEAIIAAENDKKDDPAADAEQAVPALAYFLLDSSSTDNTAEDLLKSLLYQLVDRQRQLAPYAKVFIPKEKPKSTNTAKANKQSQSMLSVENLWTSLQDMLTDDYLGTVHIVLGNLELLPDENESESTKKLLAFIRDDLNEMNIQGRKRAPVKWLFTSNTTFSVGQALKDGSTLIDLENPKYEDQVQKGLRRHANKVISQLTEDKNYNKALAYYASSLIGQRARNTQWIDMTGLRLRGLPKEEPDLAIRRVLEATPQDLNSLLDNTWLTIFKNAGDKVEGVKEMLRALILTYEDPTEAELAMLAGFSGSDERKMELREAVYLCKPLLEVTRTAPGIQEISFIDDFVRSHLLENSRKLLGLSEEETKWQHGMLALRCFSHLTERFVPPPPEEEDQEEEKKDEDAAEVNDDGEKGDEGEKPDDDAENPDNDDNGSNAGSATSDQGGDGDDDGDDEDENEDGDDDDDNDSDEEEEEEEEDEDEDEEDGNDEGSDDGSDWEEIESDFDMIPDPEEGEALEYAIVHFLHHASKATLEIADTLSQEDRFWCKDSPLRVWWLEAFDESTDTFYAEWEAKTLTALHVASAVGYLGLVSALYKNGHQDELNQRDSLNMTPLHYAAFLGRTNIAAELIKKGANVNDGIQDDESTPLHIAAAEGYPLIMQMLVGEGADVNAVSDEWGSVVTSAIASGDMKIVQMLVDKGANLFLKDSSEQDPSAYLQDRKERDLQAPLEQAATLADLTMFNYLLDNCGDKIPAVEYSKAMICAAEAGSIAVLERLLKEHSHPLDFLQEAVNAAAESTEWAAVSLILKHSQGLECNQLFISVASTSEDQDQMLDEIFDHTRKSSGPPVFEQTVDSALYEATDKEKESTVKILLERFNASPNATGDEFGNALTAACYDGSIDIVKILVDAGAVIDSPSGWALQTAVKQNWEEVVDYLLEKGANVNALTTNENFPEGTALQAACEAGWGHMVTKLIEHKADVNLGYGDEGLPILAAARKGEANILKQLIEANAEVNVSGGLFGGTPLINAALTLPVASVSLLLKKGANIHATDDDGDTALAGAVYNGDRKCLKLLLDKGADPLHVNREGKNAVQIALEKKNPGVTKLLVERWSSIMGSLVRQEKDGNTAVGEALATARKEKKPADKLPPKQDVLDLAPVREEDDAPPVPAIPAVYNEEPVSATSVYSNAATVGALDASTVAPLQPRHETPSYGAAQSYSDGYPTSQYPAPQPAAQTAQPQPQQQYQQQEYDPYFQAEGFQEPYYPPTTYQTQQQQAPAQYQQQPTPPPQRVDTPPPAPMTALSATQQFYNTQSPPAQPSYNAPSPPANKIGRRPVGAAHTPSPQPSPALSGGYKPPSETYQAYGQQQQHQPPAPALPPRPSLPSGQYGTYDGDGYGAATSYEQPTVSPLKPYKPTPPPKQQEEPQRPSYQQGHQKQPSYSLYPQQSQSQYATPSPPVQQQQPGHQQSMQSYSGQGYYGGGQGGQVPQQQIYYQPPTQQQQQQQQNSGQGSGRWGGDWFKR